MQCDLDLGDMCHWVKVMTQPLVMDNNCVITLSRFNLAVKSYDSDTDFGYVFTVNLALEI